MKCCYILSISLTMDTLSGFLNIFSDHLLQPFPAIVVALATLCAILLGYFRFNLVGKKLPPGSLGFPLIGESIGFVKAQGQDKTNQWIESRTAKYGPVFKTSLMGSPIIVLTGQAGNKFIFSANEAITSGQPKSTGRILGKNSIFELKGSRHKLMRGAMMSFLRPESIQRFVGDMDSLVQQHWLQEIKGKDSIQVVSLVKKVTFNVTCSLLFGLGEGKVRDTLLEDFTVALKGTWAVPLELPGCTYYTACKAHARLCASLTSLFKTRKKEMEEDGHHVHEDIVSTFMQLRDEDGIALREEEIIDNMVSLIIASHDTSAIVLSLLIRHLARDTHVHEMVLQEQREVLKAKEGNDTELRWDDLQKMKYTWRVAQELMRLIPPVFGNFKRTTKDITFAGFDIPKGWQLFWVACGTHMDSKIFKNPEKFDPSRFENPAMTVPPYTYIPFGAGSRACPGMDFARLEILLIVHHLIINYNWTEMVPNEPITREPMPYPAMGLPIKLHQRKDV